MMFKIKLFVIIAGLFGFLGVAAGAFGAHGLKKILSEKLLNAFEVGVRYQMFHAVALLLVALLVKQYGTPLWISAGWSFIVGIILFSGSLYLLAFTGIGVFGAITPVGGLSFLIGWILLIVGAFKTQF